MKHRSILFTLLPMLCLCIGFAYSQSADLKAVYRNGNNIFICCAGDKPQQLTNDNIPKSLPLWSKNGKEIAFLQEISPAIALGNLIVIDAETKRVIASILICPNRSGDGCVIDSVEEIEWLTENRIAVAGSVNPSTVYTLVFEINTGKELTDYIDDSGGTVFSPNGEHAASLTGSPHWTPASEQEPELEVDDHRAYPPKGVDVSFLSKPAWSQDSRMVAVVAEDYSSGKVSVVTCGFRTDCESTLLPINTSEADVSFQVYWNEDNVVVNSPESTWSFRVGDKVAAASVNDPGPKNKADQAVLGLLKRIHSLGGAEPDLWCLDCDLATLPRKAPQQ